MALWAINKQIYDSCLNNKKNEKEAIQKAKVFSLNIMQNKPFIFDKNDFLLPEYKMFYGFNRINRKVLTKEEWTFVKEYEKKDGIVVRPFFTPAHKEGEYQNYNPDSEEDQHKIAQDILLAQFLEGSLKVNFFGIKISIKNFQYKKYEDVEEYLEITKTFNNLPSSLFHKTTRRADLLIEFENWNEKFGRGIVIEIANTEQEKSLREKQNDWNNAHYSYIMLNLSNFNMLNESVRKDTILTLNAPFDKHQSNMVEKIQEYWINNKSELEILKEKVEEFKDRLRTLSSEELKEITDKITSLKSGQESIEEYKSKLDNVIKEFETKKDEIIKESLTKVGKNINEEIENIQNQIITKLKEEKIYDLLDEVYNKINITTDFKNKIDKEIFNGCEEKRRYCFNIIKEKINDYFRELKGDYEKEKDGIS